MSLKAVMRAFNSIKKGKTSLREWKNRTEMK